jgi:hypothetical protein
MPPEHSSRAGNSRKNWPILALKLEKSISKTQATEHARLTRMTVNFLQDLFVVNRKEKNGRSDCHPGTDNLPGKTNFRTFLS